MKKLIVLMAILAVVPSAFAIRGTPVSTAPNAAFSNGLLPTSTNNDDTCDISNAPAATLLLPYFEVDFRSAQTTARTTLFTITNTSDLPQIAHVVVWTDWSYPALDFNIFLTGYDVQGINMYDIFARATIAPGPTAGSGGTSSNTTVPTNPTPGSQPASNGSNPNIASLTGCTNLPGTFSPALLADLQSIFTTGRGSGAAIGCLSQVGSAHTNAIGYVTIDVAPVCHTSLPNQAGYFTQILFDNVLIGDYQDVNPNPATGNYAGGNPLVHIRAVPEGGPAGSVPGTNLPYTFYDRYTAGIVPRTLDRRQPLPSTFAARYINGGTGAFNTNFKIWREGLTIGNCTPPQAASGNANLGIAEIVRFDEHENATVIGSQQVISPAPPGFPGTPETGSYSVANTNMFPPSATSGDLGGWMYLNLNNGGAPQYSVARPGFAPAGSNTTIRASQNWVLISMFAEGRFSVDFDAAWLGNGCSPAAILSSIGSSEIGPAGGVPVCPAGVTCTPGPAYTGTNVTP